nr:methyl-accepting chemotaxis protein [Clostridium caldaquaticum]
MLSLGYFSYKMSSNALQQSIESHLKESTEQTAELIENILLNVKSSMETASLNEAIANVAQNPMDAYSDAAFQYIQNVKEKNNDSIETIIITDSKGKAIMTNETRNPDIDLSDRDYVKKAISGTASVSDVVISRFTNKPSVLIAYPLKKGDTVVGTLIGSIPFNTISKYASKVKIGTNGYAYIINKEGLLVYHPDSNKVLKENLKDINNKDLTAYFNKAVTEKTSEGFYTYQGVYKYAVFKTVGNWLIVTTSNYNEYMKPAIQIRNNTILILVIACILAIILSYVFSHKTIITPIVKLEELMKRAGEGDLSVRINIKSNDELKQLGDSFNSMINNQHDIVKQVLNAAEQLNAASEELSASSEEINAASEEISSSINKVADDAEKQNQSIINVSQVLMQLSSLVQLAQSKARAANLNTENSMKVAELGRTKVNETVKAISVINKGTDETAQVLEQLNSLSAQIGGIINAINSIAKQTNLLALNAAIEAARAGENGKGFSVVAEQIRKLSEESNDKATEISGLLNKMISYIKNAVTLMERAKIEVNNGVTIVSETDTAFVNILSAVEEIVKNIEEILNITNDEVASSDQIVKLINEIATMTENTSKTSENVSSAALEQTAAIENLTSTAEETNAMAVELTTLVEKFKL